MELIITSIKNPKIKELRLLTDTPAYREKTGLFVIEGVRFIQDALDASIAPREIFYDDRLLKREDGEGLLTQLISRSASVVKVDTSLIERLSDTVAPQGIIGIFEIPQSSFEDLLQRKEKFLLILDGVQDPGNVGTLIRTSAAFNISGVILLPGCADYYNSKALRATAGSIFRIPVVKAKSSLETMKKLRERGFNILIADSNEGKPVTQVDFNRCIALVLGNEGSGLSEEVKAFAHEVITIPMTNQVESLNVAIAGSLLIYSAFLQSQGNMVL